MFDQPTLAQPQRLSVEGAASYVGLSASTLNKLRIYSSDGPAFLKLGRRVTYDLRDLDAWLATKRRTSTSDTGAVAA